MTKQPTIICQKGNNNMTEELMKHEITKQLLTDVYNEKNTEYKQKAIDLYHRFMEACSIAAATKRDENLVIGKIK